MENIIEKLKVWILKDDKGLEYIASGIEGCDKPIDTVPIKSGSIQGCVLTGMGYFTFTLKKIEINGAIGTNTRFTRFHAMEEFIPRMNQNLTIIYPNWMYIPMLQEINYLTV